MDGEVEKNQGCEGEYKGLGVAETAGQAGRAVGKGWVMGGGEG